MAKSCVRSLDREFRRDDGALQISSDDCARILAEHLPEYNFANSGELPRTAAADLLAGRRGWNSCPWQPLSSDLPAAEGVCHPLQLTIDPIDSRFHRSLVTRNGQDPPCPGCKHRRAVTGGRFAARAVGARRRVSSNRRCRLLAVGVLGPAPGNVLSGAAAFWPGDIRRGVDAGRGRRFPVVEAIVDQAARFEESHQLRKSWRL